MEETDFKKLKHFTLQETKTAGGIIEGINFESYKKLDKFRDLLGREVNLIHNGINSGSHNAPEHKSGNAFDFWVKGIAENKDWHEVVYKLFNAGFTGVGVYYNHKTERYSFHAHSGRYGTWFGFKGYYSDPWTYKNLFFA